MKLSQSPLIVRAIKYHFFEAPTRGFYSSFITKETSIDLYTITQGNQVNWTEVHKQWYTGKRWCNFFRVRKDERIIQIDFQFTTVSSSNSVDNSAIVGVKRFLILAWPCRPFHLYHIHTIWNYCISVSSYHTFPFIHYLCIHTLWSK